MEPVRNNSDALNETVGNLSLQPAYNHNIFMMYSSFNQEKFSSFMTGLRATLTEDALTNNTIYDQTGKRYMQTVNADIIPSVADLIELLIFCSAEFVFVVSVAVPLTK